VFRIFETYLVQRIHSADIYPYYAHN
jgi:hypothetical protein